MRDVASATRIRHTRATMSARAVSMRVNFTWRLTLGCGHVVERKATSETADEHPTRARCAACGDEAPRRG